MTHPPPWPCPCCDHLTLSSWGDYDICPVCFWENDGIDLDRPDTVSGPNHLTLREARANFARIGACDERALRHVLSTAGRGAFRHIPRKTPPVA